MREKAWPKGLSRDAKGWRLSVRIGKTLHQKRGHHSHTLDSASQALADWRKKLEAGRSRPIGDSFAADVARYLRDYCTGRPCYAERSRHLDLWTEALGTFMRRQTVTRDDIARVLNGWRAAGLSPETCNKRRTALLALYHALDGKGGSNPVREVPKFRVADPLPRGLEYRQIERAFTKFPQCKTLARLMVIAYTGIRHGQLMHLTPESWDKRRNLLTIPATSKGCGTKAYVIPLSTPAAKALKLLDHLDGWGPFSWAPMARMWQAAATKAKLPPGTRPYDLRHSFGTAIYRATGDIRAAKELLGHSSLRMTERYTLAAVKHQNVQAIRAFEQHATRRKSG